MARESAGYGCRECGATFLRWSGRCPSCGMWDALEERPAAAPERRPDVEPRPVVALADLPVQGRRRVSTGIPEFDRVLGGGVLLGSTVLVGGAPGVGKSTILLQALGRMAGAGLDCLYVSCEESLDQVKMRAERLGLGGSGMRVSEEATLEGALALLAATTPDAAVVDSIQRVASPSIPSAPGSLRQVTTCATELTAACKAAGCALFLVGHVTKQGLIAGPRALEHLVDTVLYFESEASQSLRILRAAKNRFGAVDEIGVFQMAADGLQEVANPSALFLAEREPGASGSVVTAALEGTRALLVEIQALVGPAVYGTPERKVSGADYRRVSMMLSVMERRTGLELARCDAFVNVAGGMQVQEPAADLPLCLALASSLREQPFPGNAVAFGEVGLGGEVRAVGHAVERLTEAARLGFRQAVVPEGNAHSAARAFGGDVHGVRSLAEALAYLGASA